MSPLPLQPFICVLILQLSSTIFADDSLLQTYIVHVDLPDFTQVSSNLGISQDSESWYKSFLPTAVADSTATSRLIYPYRRVFPGFAAKLTPVEVKEMEMKKGFLSARPQQLLSLDTTHSPNFLGLHQAIGFWNESNYGKGVIIGVLDSGILPDHPSFSDEGMPPPPAKWKGRCEFNYTGACNNKLIGARHFRDGDGTPLDRTGHGTHTASTAAGNFVTGASVYGNAIGTAVGIAPLAHLAVYKVCTSNIRCPESDILEAMDTAIDDGVDVLSISLSLPSTPFHNDNIALGAFSAMERGIFVSASASNDGPSNFSSSNEAPWILTVGASTIDRKILAAAILGDGQELIGESGFQPTDFSATLLPMVYPGSNISDPSARFCSRRLVTSTVKDKIVVCHVGETSAVQKGAVVRDAGGAAMIVINDEQMGFTTLVDAHVLPATNVNYEDGLKILRYINSTASPTARIVFNGTIIGDNNSPMVASFSSRGPSKASPGILKPDIIGPGVNILAAWPTSVENNTNTQQTFNFNYGTSMSCPHLSGVGALLKSAHPDWSPAAIKSAIMTTADTVNLEMKPILDQRLLLPADIFATGAGHVNPSRANSPGLIYDLQPRDYLPYLCGLNYTDLEMGVLLQRRVNCSAKSSILEGQLNYPSFTWRFSSPNQTFTRTLTNVGEANSTYTVELVPPRDVDVAVDPRRLSFIRLNQKLTYSVAFSRSRDGGSFSVSQGYIMWKSAKYSVRSPIAVF